MPTILEAPEPEEVHHNKTHPIMDLEAFTVQDILEPILRNLNRFLNLRQN